MWRRARGLEQLGEHGVDVLVRFVDAEDGDRPTDARVDERDGSGDEHDHPKLNDVDDVDIGSRRGWGHGACFRGGLRPVSLGSRRRR